MQTTCWLTGTNWASDSFWDYPAEPWLPEIISSVSQRCIPFIVFIFQDSTSHTVHGDHLDVSTQRHSHEREVVGSVCYTSLILPTGLMHSFIFMFYEINGCARHRLTWLQMLCESICKRGTALSERLRFTSESSTWHELIPKQEVNDVALPIPHFLSLHFLPGSRCNTHTDTL